MDRLRLYRALLGKWQRSINLVAGRSMDQAWNRHFLDSAQLAPHVPEGARSHVDLGSGAGFPGLVLAIMMPVLTTHLVESDIRKATFLREVARETGTSVTVHASRLEVVELPGADLVTARALAGLDSLLDGVTRFLSPTGVALLPKGAAWNTEIEQARGRWHFSVQPLPSVTEPEGRILRMEAISHD